MQNHTKIYATFFGHQVPEDFSCEVCGNPAVDINHIDARGMGGNPSGDKDQIENLMAMCRKDHIEYGDVPQYKPLLRLIHLKYMLYTGLASQIEKYGRESLMKSIHLAEVEVNNNVGNSIYDIKP